MSWRLQGDEHYRVSPLEILGSGVVTAAAVGLTLAGAVALVLLWGSASPFGKVLLVTGEAILVCFAVIVGAYQWYDLAELRDRHGYNRNRRAILLERLELALETDLDGDGVVGRVTATDLPRLIPVHAQGVRLTPEDGDGQDNGTDPLLLQLDELVDEAARRGLSRSALIRRFGRELYDYALSTAPEKPGLLVLLGLVAGRSKGTPGRLRYDAETTKAVLRRAWQRALTSTPQDGNGQKPGMGPGQARPAR